jgi:hypothetical protein
MFSVNGRIRIYAGGGDAPCNGRILSCQWPGTQQGRSSRQIMAPEIAFLSPAT